jgi:hypothetical protein
MFDSVRFERLYNMLDLDMVDGDCGIRCGKFCCVGNGDSDNAFKYLLPGEAEYLVLHGFHHHAVLEDFGFLIHYRSESPDLCVCEKIRAFRPFCCRMFPFRPVVDASSETVTCLVKTENERFSPCWVEQPSPSWRARAIAAWNFLFSDPDNLRFYAQYYLCLKKSEESSASFAQAMEEDRSFQEEINSLYKLSSRNLWELCSKFFSSI